MAFAAFWLALWPLGVALFTLNRGFAARRAGMRAAHVWERWCARVLGLRIAVEGRPPRGTYLFVANHLSYLDAFALGAVYPSLFLAMAELKGWPLVGFLARLGGTLFVVRDRADAERARGELARHLAAGFPITLFPEAHPSRGAAVARFHASMLEAAVRTGTPCVPVSLSYALPEAPEAASTQVCWWGSMPFLGHAWRLLGFRRIEAHVRFGEPVAPGGDRYQLAEALHAAVVAGFRPVLQPPDAHI